MASKPIELDYTRLDVFANEEHGTIDLLLWDDKAIASGNALAAVTLSRAEAAQLAEEIRQAVDSLTP